MITTQAALRAEFWRTHRQFRKTVTRHQEFNGRTLESKTAVRDTVQNEYPTDVRVAWCDFVEATYRSGQITGALAERVSL